MALILNLSVFVQNGSHFDCYHGNRELIFFIALTMQKKSHQPAFHINGKTSLNVHGWQLNENIVFGLCTYNGY